METLNLSNVYNGNLKPIKCMQWQFKPFKHLQWQLKPVKHLQWSLDQPANHTRNANINRKGT